MASESQIKYCDQLVQHIMKLLCGPTTSGNILKMGRKGFETDGRGFIPMVFDSDREAMDMLKNYKRNYIVRVDTAYLSASTIDKIGHDELKELVNSYDPEKETVCLLSVGWGIETPTDQHIDVPNASMKAFIISTITPTVDIIHDQK